MFTDVTEEVRVRADECRREAARATNAADVMAWLSLADEWRKLSRADDGDCATILTTRAAADTRVSLALV
jgi:hypothetical protein